MRWTKEVIEDTKEALSRTQTLAEAVELLEEEYGYDWITTSGLRTAFYRHEIGKTSSFLATHEKTEHVNKSSNLNNYFRVKENGYEVGYNGREYVIDETRMQTAVTLYSSKKHGGLSYSAAEVAQYFIQHGWLPNDTDHKLWYFIFHEMEQYKFLTPETLLQRRHDAGEVSSSNRMLREAIKRQESSLHREIEDYKKIILTLEKDLSYFTSLERFLDGAVDGEPGIKNIKPSKICRDGSVLILMVSDLHAGLKYDTGSLHRGRAAFNKDVFIERIENYISYMKLVASRPVGRIEHVHFAFLGDNFEALLANMRKGQFLSMDLFGAEQYALAVDGLTEIAKAACRLFPDATKDLVFQPGNHDRSTKDKTFHSENMIVSAMVREISLRLEVAGVLGEGDRCVFADRTASILLPNKVGVVSRHGDRGGNSSLSPVRGLKMDKTHRPRGAVRTIYLQGHFHNFQVRRFDDVLMVTNPAFCGDNEYNLDDLELSAPPEFVAIESLEHSDVFHGPYNLLVRKL